MGTESWVCTHCGNAYPIEQFYHYRNDRRHSWCKPCERQWTKEHRKPDKRDPLARKAWNEKNAERVREAKLRWLNANRAKHNESVKRWNAANKEKIRRAKAKWRKANSEWINEKNRRQRQKRLLAQGRFTSAEFAELKAKYSNRCLRCGMGEPEVKLIADHVTPIAKGGSHDWSNRQLLCKSCNEWKRDLVLDFRPEEREAS
jgi:HNH endonuclease